ncbi:MAG TPA: hypothetical protein VE959_15070 [Bryobacteraceae bacterium]|nr:hypothetical protein [Bryobacteraceae bacterium]
MNSLFVLLVRHFFGRFFDNEIVSQQGDMRTNVVQALGLLAVPGMFVPFYMLPQRVRFFHPFEANWLLVSDYYFFVMYSMIVMGLVMVFQWDALFPDRKDYLILTPLPLGGGSIFAGKTMALLLFLGLFVVDANFFGTGLAPLVSGGEGTPAVVIWRLFTIHLLVVLSAGAFVTLVFAGLQGVLINLLTGRAFRRISPWVQMASMGLLITVLFLTPLTQATLRPLFERHSPLLRWFPPFWFLALYVDLLPGRPGGAIFHDLAPMAGRALEISAAVFAVTYLAGYRRHSRRVMESLETAGEGPSRLRRAFDALVNRRLLPHPLERATFHFISNTILRSARHRLFLATYPGIAVALAVPSVLVIGAKPGLPILILSAAGLLPIPLTLSFFTVSGLRGAFNLPAELRANWVFQVCESEDSAAHLRAARKWIVTMGIVPLFALLSPLEFLWAPGWVAALVYLTFALLLSLLMLNLLMVWFRKIPFTCSYFPGKTSMAVMAALYLAGFTTYAWSMASLEQKLMRSPMELALFYALGLLALFGLLLLEKRERGVDDSLIYEDQPEPIVRTLELS